MQRHRRAGSWRAAILAGAGARAGWSGGVAPVWGSYIEGKRKRDGIEYGILRSNITYADLCVEIITRELGIYSRICTCKSVRRYFSNFVNLQRYA